MSITSVPIRNNKEELEVVWEFEADPDAAEKVRQAYEMLLGDLPDQPPAEQPVKKQGRLFSIKQLLGLKRKEEK